MGFFFQCFSDYVSALDVHRARGTTEGVLLCCCTAVRQSSYPCQRGFSSCDFDVVLCWFLFTLCLHFCCFLFFFPPVSRMFCFGLFFSLFFVSIRGMHAAARCMLMRHAVLTPSTTLVGPKLSSSICMYLMLPRYPSRPPGLGTN